MWIPERGVSMKNSKTITGITVAVLGSVIALGMYGVLSGDMTLKEFSASWESTCVAVVAYWLRGEQGE